jgi:Aldo/keto reductase family
MVILIGNRGSSARKKPLSMLDLRKCPHLTFISFKFCHLISLPRPESYEHGVNTFDTANSYSNGLSEVYLGRAIKALNLPREEIVVMTKAGLTLCSLPFP